MTKQQLIMSVVMLAVGIALIFISSHWMYSGYYVRSPNGGMRWVEAQVPAAVCGCVIGMACIGVFGGAAGRWVWDKLGRKLRDCP